VRSPLGFWDGPPVISHRWQQTSVAGWVAQPLPRRQDGGWHSRHHPLAARVGVIAPVLAHRFVDHLAASARHCMAEDTQPAGQHFFANLRGQLPDRLRDLTFWRQHLRHVQKAPQPGTLSGPVVCNINRFREAVGGVFRGARAPWEPGHGVFCLKNWHSRSVPRFPRAEGGCAPAGERGARSANGVPHRGRLETPGGTSDRSALRMRVSAPRSITPEWVNAVRRGTPGRQCPSGENRLPGGLTARLPRNKI
jgi:hypothetical protein